MSLSKNVTLKNTTGVVVTGITWTASPGDFQVVAHTCGNTLNVNASCTISVAFSPQTIGARTGTLTISDSASNSPQTVSLTGTGILPVTLTPASLKFPGTKVGLTSAAKIVSMKNYLPTTLTINGISIIGTDQGDFQVSKSGTTCGSSLSAGSSCTIGIAFTPSTKGSRSAQLNVSDNGVTSPQTVALSGTGK